LAVAVVWTPGIAGRPGSCGPDFAAFGRASAWGLVLRIGPSGGARLPEGFARDVCFSCVCLFVARLRIPCRSDARQQCPTCNCFAARRLGGGQRGERRAETGRRRRGPLWWTRESACTLTSLTTIWVDFALRPLAIVLSPTLPTLMSRHLADDLTGFLPKPWAKIDGIGVLVTTRAPKVIEAINDSRLGRGGLALPGGSFKPRSRNRSSSSVLQHCSTRWPSGRPAVCQGA